MDEIPLRTYVKVIGTHAAIVGGITALGVVAVDIIKIAHQLNKEN